MSNLKRALQLRYAPITKRLADGIAGDINQALQLEVTRQLSKKLAHSAGVTAFGARLGDFVRRYHWQCRIIKWLTIGNVFCCLFGAVDFRLNPYARILLLTSASGSALVAKSLHQSARSSLAIASILSQIEAAEAVAKLARISKPLSTTNIVEETVVEEPQPTRTIPNFDAQAILEEATGIGLLGNSGSAKSTIAKYLAGEMGSTQILVLDPHDDPENANWEGLKVIRDYELIAKQLELLLELLDNRDRTPLVIICDEWPAVRAWCKQQKLDIADRFLLRYGSEARKFLKLPIFCSQSGNTKALGLEGMGDFLENFMLIRLQKVAIKYARNLPDQSVLQHCKSVAYACLIGDEPVIHPTHGHHQRAYKGATPKGLKPLRSEPLTIQLAR